MPKVDRARADAYERQSYPGSLRERTNGCWKTRLSDQVGLSQIGVGEVRLAPGGATSLMHWHEGEDEFVYVLEGEVVLVEGDAELVLCAGDSAGWRAGVSVGHTIENRSSAPARLLEIGPRGGERETAHYSGLDMVYHRDGDAVRFTTREGALLTSDHEPTKLDNFRSAPLANRSPAGRKPSDV